MPHDGPIDQAERRDAERAQNGKRSTSNNFEHINLQKEMQTPACIYIYISYHISYIQIYTNIIYIYVYIYIHIYINDIYIYDKYIHIFVCIYIYGKLFGCCLLSVTITCEKSNKFIYVPFIHRGVGWRCSRFEPLSQSFRCLWIRLW